ncbi:hypothetical protein F5Y17DRAFT_86655 [Xylariaceae sp. FL0594]|nr:hypothetical protein F5Y17DRAFT_86655 [Xylariaceae sp. FL0594]
MDMTLPMSSTVHGDKLSKAQAALEELSNDPDLLNRSRNRFANPPRLVPSGSTSRSLSLAPSDEEARRFDAWYSRLKRMHNAARPQLQFDAQVEELYNQIYKPTDPSETGNDWVRDVAKAVVKKDWVEQGIWDERWKRKPREHWKHERPPELATQSETVIRNIFTKQAEPCPEPEPEPEPKRKDEPSRPIFQFCHQVSKERELIIKEIHEPGASVPKLSDFVPELRSPMRDDKPSIQQTTVSIPLDVNSKAYERVRQRWVDRGIWVAKWGILPGMSWRHEEQSMDEWLREQMGADFDRLHTPHVGPRQHWDKQRVSETPAAAPLPNIFPSSKKAESSGTTNMPPQEKAPVIDEATLPSGDPDYPPTASGVSRDPNVEEAQKASSPVTPPKPRRGRQRLGGKGGHDVAHSALGPIHPSKVTKAREKTRTAPLKVPKAEPQPGAQQEPALVPSDLQSPPKEEVPAPSQGSEHLQEGNDDVAVEPQHNGRQPRRRPTRADQNLLFQQNLKG